MAQALYKVVLSGDLHDEFEKEAVVEELSTLFKCPQTKAAGLLAGKPTKLKKEMPREQAEKYCARLDKAGVKCSIESIAPAAPQGLSLEPTQQAEPDAEPKPESKPEPKQEPGGLSLESSAPPQTGGLSLEPAAPAEPEGLSLESTAPPESGGLSLEPTAPPESGGLSLEPTDPPEPGGLSLEPTAPAEPEGLSLEPTMPPESGGLSLESTAPPESGGLSLEPATPAETGGLSLESTAPPEPEGLSLSMADSSAQQEPQQSSPEETQQSVEPGQMVCPKCQAQQVKAEQCASCGIFIAKFLASQVAQSDDTAESAPAEASGMRGSDDDEADGLHELSLFVGDAFDDKYRLRFAEIQDNGDKYVKDWNWAAFLVPVAWMIHRKMYLFAAAYFFIGFILPGFVMFGLHITMGLMGSFLYYRYAQHQIDKIPGGGLERDEAIIAKGGVLPIPLVIGISIATTFLLSMLFYAIFVGPSVMKATNEISNDLASMGKDVDQEAAMGMVSLKAAINMHITLTSVDFDSNDLPVSVDDLQKKYKLPEELFYDKWNTEIDYRKITSGYTLRSAGPDQEFDTSDDIVVKSLF